MGRESESKEVRELFYIIHVHVHAYIHTVKVLPISRNFKTHYEAVCCNCMHATCAAGSTNMYTKQK